MTRIVAGQWGGRRIATPAGAGTRPTSDRVREGLFSALSSMTDLAGAYVADLYAGSGAIGLEAVSRGAAHALLVESDPKAARVIRQNIAALDAGNAVALTVGSVATVLAAGPPPGQRYDIVVADPPYHVCEEEISAMLAALAGAGTGTASAAAADDGWLAAGAVLVVERSSRGSQPDWPDNITLVRGRQYGETTLWYGRRS